MSKTSRFLLAALLAGGIALPPSILAQNREGASRSASSSRDNDKKDDKEERSLRSSREGSQAKRAESDEEEAEQAIFGPTERSAAATRVVHWITDSRDNGAMPFIVIDKKAATVFVYDSKGQPLGDTPALIGIANGDDSTPGVGSKTLAELGPAEKTTPAGRFVARIGPAAGGQKVLWVDYDTSVALHAVVTGNKKERRLERLLSPSIRDNRITFGCINVPTHFYKQRVQPIFEKTGGIVYVLPDEKSLESVFPKLRSSRIASR